jgi:WD40 repeat protein
MLLATGGDDGIARIWSVRSGRQLQILPGHTDQLNGVAFSPDGTRLATVSSDGTLLVYALSAGELARIGRARLTRGFTRAECVQYLHLATCPRSAPSPSASPTTGPTGSPASVAPEGAFRVSIDRGDLQRSGIPRREWAFDAGDYTVTFLDGTWRVHQQLRGTQCGIGPKSCEWDGSGTYTVSGSRITMRFLTEPACFGCTLSADWSLEPTALAMRGFAASVPGRFAPGSGFTAAWSLILGSRPLARAA